MSYTVADLVEGLQKLPQDLIVILSKDEEGNGFKKFAGLSLEVARDPEDYYIELRDEEDEDGPTYKDPNVVVLWP